MSEIEAVVVGVDHFNTLGIIRSLGEIGICPVAVILSDEKKTAWTLKSKYLNKGLSCTTSLNDHTNSLIKIGKSFETKAYLIPSCDAAVKVIDDKKESLEKYYLLPNIYGGEEKISKCLNKAFMAKKAEEAGFLVPVTMSLFANDSLQIEIAKKRFAELYPLIIKEDSSVAGKNHTRIIETEDDLEKAFKECGTDYVMLQQFISKDEELGIQGVSHGTDTPFIPGTIHKIRTSLDSMGSTTYAKLTNGVDIDLKKKCEAFIQSLQYSGIFDIEVLRKGRDYYFIECNFRNGAYGYAYTRLGYNLPEIWIKKYIPPKSSISSIQLINGFNDIKHIKAGNVGALTWVKELLSADVKLTAQIRDMAPVFYRLVFR